jgi:hypothetical protein
VTDGQTDGTGCIMIIIFGKAELGDSNEDKISLKVSYNLKMVMIYNVNMQYEPPLENTK